MASGFRTRKPREKRVVPLVRRLRNPPPTFLGRDAEVAQVHAAMQRGRLVVVWGPAGLGKTSLVERAIFTLGEQAVARTLCFTLAAGDASGEQLALELLTALRDVAGEPRARRVDIEDVTSFCASAIDLADAVNAIVFIDDAHHPSGGLVSELCALAARYARASRFVVASRVELDVASEPQSIALGPLAEGPMVELARAWSRGLPEREARTAAKDAEGSPFWLKQRLMAGRGSGLSLRSSLLEGLDADSAAWLELLGSLEVPLPVAALDGARRDGRALQHVAPELEARGLVERTNDGIRIHGGARSVFPALLGPAQRNLARSLGATKLPQASLEALRLLVGAGDHQGAEALLLGELEPIVDAGLAPRLWQVLGSTPADRYVRAKLRAAVEIGGGKAVQWALALPPPAVPRDRLAWVKSLAYGGRLVEAAAASETLEGELAHDPIVAFDAMFFGVRCLVTMGDARAALLRVRDALVTTAEQRALLDGWVARAHVLMEDDRTALDIVERLDAGLGSLDEATRGEVQIQRAIVLAELGRVNAARAALDEAGSDAGGSPDLRGTQRRLIRHATIATELGELAEAERITGLLMPRSVGNRELATLLGAIELRVTVARSGAPRLVSTGTSPLGRALAVLRGVGRDGVGQGVELASDRADVATVQRIAASRAALVRGEHERAREHAMAGVSLAEGHGLVLWALEARLALADAILLAGAPGMEEVAATLAAFDDRVRSPRFASESRFYRALAEREADIRALDALARSQTDAIAAVRRSRVLLGSDEGLDLVDQAVVSALARRLGIAHVRTGNGYRAGLLLDTRRGRAMLPDGDAVELGGKPLCMKLLLALFEKGGAASKADLVRAAWARSDYHPFRDDKRLQVAIGRLRQALGDDLSDPRLILTTAEGYRFPPKLPVHRV